MIDPADWKNRVGYHPATGDVGETHDSARRDIYYLGLRILESTRPSREQSLAITHLEEALMWTNKAIAIHETPLAEDWDNV